MGTLSATLIVHPTTTASSGGVQRTLNTWVVENGGGEWQIVFQRYTPQL